MVRIKNRYFVVDLIWSTSEENMLDSARGTGVLPLPVG